MIKRPKPKVLPKEAVETILNASAQQSPAMQKIRSYDPDYPVFEVPVNERVLVYIPNHTIQSPDGSIDMRMDKFTAHAVIDGRSFEDVRCTRGLVNAELGLDGSCPLCDSMSKIWELYNLEYADIARTKGIDPKSAEANELLKEDRKNLAKQMVIKNPEVWYTFPIVVIECAEKDGKMTTTPKTDENGRLNGKVMWYSIRERTYLEKWGAGFDALGDGDENGDMDIPTNPAGLWAVLNFTYTPKSGKHDKMGSAKALKVAFKRLPAYSEWATYFDKLTENWTPQKAMETVVLDAMRDMEEMNQVRDTLMKPVEDKLTMYALGAATAGAPAVSGSAEQALANFGATPAEPAGVPEAPVAPPQTAGELPQSNLTAEMPNVGVDTE